MSPSALYDMYVQSTDEFKCSKHFRQQIRFIDPEMTGEYELDCSIFDQKMFELVNSILLYKY